MTKATVKKTVLVIWEKTIEIEMTESAFGGLTVEQYLRSFSDGLWKVESIDDVIKYAAHASFNEGCCEEDGLGLLNRAGSEHPRSGDTLYRVIDEGVECEILGVEA